MNPNARYCLTVAALVRAVTLKGSFVPFGGVMGVLKYAVVGAVIAVVVITALVLLLPTLHRAPVQYFGSPSGYEAFVPNGQTINYNGNTDPTGTLILSIWNYDTKRGVGWTVC